MLYVPIMEVVLCTMTIWQREFTELPLCLVHVSLGVSNALQAASWC